MRASARYLDGVSGLQAVLVGDGELRKARAAAIVIHGGKEESLAPVAENQAAVLRMVPIARHLVKIGAKHGLAVWRMRFRYRGWNNEAAHPLEDMRWAIRQLRMRHGDVPMVLVGHSMGGRAAMLSASEQGVTAVLGLAPWLPPDEPRQQLSGRRLLVVHGSRDRVTSPARSREFVHSVRALASDATYIGVRHSGHTMLWRPHVWNRLVAEFVFHVGLGMEPAPELATAMAARDSML